MSIQFPIEQIGSRELEDISDESLDFLSDEISTMLSLQEFAKLTTKEKNKEYEKLRSLMMEKNEELKEVKRQRDMAQQQALNYSESTRLSAESAMDLAKSNAILMEQVKSVSEKSNDENQETSKGFLEKFVAFQVHVKGKEQKKNNIVIYGLPEVNEDENAQGEDDVRFMKDALSAIGCDDDSKID